MAGLLKAQTIQEAIGTIKEFAGSSAPTKWLVCNGTAISRTTYSDLFALIGTTYGAGDGSTTFNIPDFQGRSPKGVGTSNGGTDVAHVAETVSLGTKYNDRMQGHFHTSIERGNISASGGAKTNNTAQGDNTPVTNYAREAVADLVNGTPRIGTTTTGKCLGVNFIIKAVI